MTPIPPLTESPWTLDRLGPPALAFVVAGDPAPQGSKSYKGSRPSKTNPRQMTPILVESSAERVRAWRDDVKAAFFEARPRVWQPLADDNRDGVVVDMVFTRRRPKGLVKSQLCWPGSTPDLGKLARSTEDALTAAGAYGDDARIIGFRRLDKVYVGSGDPDALPHPGAVIRLWALRGSAYDVPPTRRTRR
jgi:Holliday junction resolvase RusA-like endonuclease